MNSGSGFRSNLQRVHIDAIHHVVSAHTNGMVMMIQMMTVMLLLLEML
jgi:hypothetical protein